MDPTAQPDPPAPPRRWGRPWCAGVLVAALAGLTGCNTLKWLVPDTTPDRVKVAANDPARLPSKYHLRIAPYVFHSDVELRRDDPIFRDLAGLRDQVYSELRLTPGTAEVQVYLFETRDRYERYIAQRKLPNRRAFFIVDPPKTIGGADVLQAFTFWSDKDSIDRDRIRQDLRHELTHALLHSVLKEVPIWLDEGLAEYFELPPGRKGVNAVHLAGLRKLGPAFQPDLARLERLTEVDEMKPAEYSEAWAWVHLMLTSTPEARAALLQYVHGLKDTAKPPPLRPRLAAALPSPDEALERHLQSLEAPAPPVVPTAGSR